MPLVFISLLSTCYFFTILLTKDLKLEIYVDEWVHSGREDLEEQELGPHERLHTPGSGAFYTHAQMFIHTPNLKVSKNE